jgi:hypothetical protein
MDTFIDPRDDRTPTNEPEVVSSAGLLDARVIALIVLEPGHGPDRERRHGGWARPAGYFKD